MHSIYINISTFVEISKTLSYYVLQTKIKLLEDSALCLTYILEMVTRSNKMDSTSTIQIDYHLFFHLQMVTSLKLKNSIVQFLDIKIEALFVSEIMN